MSEELCYGSFIVKKKLKNRFSVSIAFRLLHSWEQVFIYHLREGVGKFLGDPTVFKGERRGISRLQQSLEEQL